MFVSLPLCIPHYDPIEPSETQVTKYTSDVSLFNYNRNGQNPRFGLFFTLDKFDQGPTTTDNARNLLGRAGPIGRVDVAGETLLNELSGSTSSGRQFYTFILEAV